VGRPLNEVVVGSFTDPASLPGYDYQAVVDWGDSVLQSGGQPQTSTPHWRSLKTGSVHQLYIITGSHTYHGTGIFPINITISASDGRTAYLVSIVRVH